MFLHDPRLICSTAHSITRQKNKEDNAGDTLFWPVTSGEVSSRNLEHNFHPYAVPVPQNDQYRLHDQALYSLWNHYVEFCRANSKMQHKMANAGPILEDASTVFTPRDVPINAFTHCQRLPVFQLLSSSNGETILPQQFALATHNGKYCDSIYLPKRTQYLTCCLSIYCRVGTTECPDHLCEVCASRDASVAHVDRR